MRPNIYGLFKYFIKKLKSSKKILKKLATYEIVSPTLPKNSSKNSQYSRSYISLGKRP